MINWTYFLILSLCASFLQPAFAAPDVIEGRIPLATMVAGSVQSYIPSAGTQRDEQPTVTVGRLSDSAAWQLDHWINSSGESRRRLFNALPSLESGMLRPDDHSPTYLLVMSPTLMSGWNWIPINLLRSGNILTLDLESWTDFFGRAANSPFRAAYLLSTGTLSAGHYKLRVKLNFLHMDVTTAPHLYGLDGQKSGDLPFQICAAGTVPLSQPAPALRVTQMRTDAVPPGQSLSFQPLFYLPHAPVYELYSNGSMEVPKPGLRVGTFNFKSWRGAAQTEASAQLTVSRDLPLLSQPGPGDPLYAEVVGPWLNSGEWMALRSIQWKGNEARLNVEVWRDDGARKRNAVYVPLLLVPLQPPGRTPRNGQFKVAVEWNWLRAPLQGGLYSPDTRPDPQVTLQGMDQVAITFHPELTTPTISQVVITTQPAPLGPAGGKVMLKCIIQSPAGLNVTTAPPQVDVTRGGLSILGGPRPLFSLSSQKDTWAYQFTAPANANNFADDEYSITITASDNHGGKIDPPAVVGTFTVPNMP